MKILIVNIYYGLFGGAEIIANNTFDILKKEGHDVYFWSCNKQPFINDKYDYIKYFTKYNGGIKNYLKNPLKYYYNVNAKKDLAKFIALIKPDIIHIHNVQNLSSSIYEACRDIATVRTIHDASIICPKGTMINRINQICQNKCKNGNYKQCLFNICTGNIESSCRYTIKSYFDTRLYKYIDKFITPSNALRNALIASNIGIKETNSVTINNFLNNEELKTTPSYTNQGYFLYIGRLSKEKSVITLLQAMQDLPKEIKLHIVGTGPEEDNLKKYAKENGLHNIKFLGFKTGEDIKHEYQNCISTILPCNGFEIFGMTNIESFINGKPVIASNIGGIPEIVEDNVNGLLFEPANVEQLRECILKYWNNPELVIEHGKNGYKKVLTHYTEDIYYEKLIQLYEETINEYKK